MTVKNTLKNARAFSLLEIMVALSLFAFLFLFITQMVRQNHRQVTKIKKDLEVTGSIYHSLNLIKQDLSSSTYFLDLSYNFKLYFPLKVEDSAEGSSRASVSRPSETRNTVLLDPQIIFKGTSQEMEFVSYSFSKNSRFKQWMKIRYAVEDCPSGSTPGDCLMRYEKLDWNRYEEEDWEESALVVREGLESLQFLYSNDYGLESEEWEEIWEPKPQIFQENKRGRQGGASLSQDSPQEIPLPARVQITFKEKDSPQEIWIFPVSQARLKEWSPYEKGFNSFKKWTPPKEKKTNRKNKTATKSQRTQ